MEFETKNNLPKVLVCYIVPWRDSGAQHSLAEIFSCWDKDRVALVYARAELPNTKYCDKFFRINENAVMKSVFNRKVKTSSVVYNSDGSDGLSEEKDCEKEKQRYRNTSKGRNWFMVYARELVWKLGKWKTPELNAFLDEFSPDLVFFPMGSEVYMTRLHRYIAKYTKKPVVSYLIDDTVTFKPELSNPLGFFRRIFSVRNNRYLLKHSKKVFVMVPKAQQELKEILGVDSSILTKSVDFSDLSHRERKCNLPLKMVYTGALSIGREKELCAIAKAVAAINSDKEKLKFEIYSADTPRDKNQRVLNSGGCRFCGSVSREKVRELQNEADIVVFAESLSKRFKNLARLSFSTKLTDYFASGSCIFALGSDSVAPIEYLKNEDAAVVVTRREDIEQKLRELCDKPELVSEYGRKAFLCGKRNHSADKVLSEFKAQMCSIQ